jgi:hypothetical protein
MRRTICYRSRMSSANHPDVGSMDQRIAHQSDSTEIVHPSDVISQLHEELIAAQARREEAGLRPLFEVESLEIELKVAISATKTVGGKLDVRILAVTKDTSLDEARTQTIRLKLRTVTDADTPGNAYGSRPSVKRSSKTL